jgi:predicted GNAT superfamily acetyltransferase
MTAQAAMRPLEKTIAVRGRRFLLRVETSPAADDYAKYEALREEIWGFPADHLASPLNMMSESVFHEGGSVFIGAFAQAGEEGYFETDSRYLAGFCYGYVGLRDPEAGYRDLANLRFYAQYAGVRRAFQGYGLAVLLKDYQGEIVRDLLGVSTVICTYDPLTGVNANRNIHRFGMDVLEYRAATYGEYGGLLNRPDVPTDRFLVSWDLDRTAERPARDPEAVLSAPETIRAGLRTVAGKSGPIGLEVVEAVRPEAEGDTLLARIPLDFYRMLQETDVADPEVKRIPVDWRLATRRVFTSLFARGFRVADFLKATEGRPLNCYVLRREGGPKT